MTRIILSDVMVGNTPVTNPTLFIDLNMNLKIPFAFSIQREYELVTPEVFLLEVDYGFMFCFLKMSDPAQ